MVSSIIKIAIGYFVTYYVPGILKIRGPLEKIIRLIGIVIIIGGFVGLVRAVL